MLLVADPAVIYLWSLGYYVSNFENADNISGREKMKHLFLASSKREPPYFFFFFFFPLHTHHNPRPFVLAS